MCRLVVRVAGYSMMGWDGYVNVLFLIVVMCN